MRAVGGDWFWRGAVQGAENINDGIWDETLAAVHISQRMKRKQVTQAF